MNNPYGKIHLFPDEKVFILKNWKIMNYSQLLDGINANRNSSNKISYPTLRHRLKEMGLQRFQLQRWSKRQTQFLIDNYQTMGNKEIAQYLNKKYKTLKKLTRSQVNKKMDLLELKRTPKELHAIRKRNLKLGLTKAEPPRKPSHEGAISICKANNGRPMRRIKINGYFIPFGRWNYIQKRGEVPNGYVLFRKDQDPLNDEIGNFECRKSRQVSYDDAIRAKKLLAERIDMQIANLNGPKSHAELNRLNALLNKMNRIIERRDRSNA